MTTFASLKLTAAQKPINVTATQARRVKLAQRMDEQIGLATAMLAGTHYTATRLQTVTDAETGARTKVATNKRVKCWWFTAENGKLALSVRYGARQLELAKGKFAVEVASEKELVPTLEVIKAAVLDGQLDSAIDAASNKLRAGFAK
jgi:hypothetical protein